MLQKKIIHLFTKFKMNFFERVNTKQNQGHEIEF